MLKIGTIIDNKYEILKNIGEGGMSTVWLAMDIRLNKQWAIKEIHKNPKRTFRQINIDSALKEAELMKKLDHIALPRIVDLKKTEDSLLVIMDYIEGENLFNILTLEGKQNVEDCINWTIQLCEVLNYLHTRNPPIIYRDLKPSNIIITPNGNVKLIDFGIAREYKYDNSEDTTCLGTVGYASPEHNDKSRQTDARSDIYSLGVTLFFMLTGKNPRTCNFKKESITKYDASLSQGLDKVVKKCYRDNPEERYQTVKELAYALLNYKTLEDKYLKELKKEYKKPFIVISLGLVMMIIGSSLLGANHVKNIRTYENLITTVGIHREENIKKAIELKPTKAEGYIELIKTYAATDGFKEEESLEFLKTFNSNKDNIKKNKEYYKLNYDIAEYYIMYYEGVSDKSLRNKLITVKPFLTEALKGNKEEDYFSKASVYMFFTKYYEEYVMANDMLGLKDVTNETLINLINKSNSILNIVSKTNKTNLKQVTMNLVLDIVENEKEDFVILKIQEGYVLNLLDMVLSLNEKTISNNTYNQNEIKKRSIDLKETVKLMYAEDRKEI